MKRLASSCILLWLIFGAFSAHAQGGGDDRKRQVQSLILMRLSQNLGLNNNQSAQLGQILQKHHDRRHTLRKEMKGLNQQLRDATAAGNEAEIQKLLTATSRARSDFDQIDDQLFNDVRPLLSPKQQAQFLIEMDEIRSEIRAIKHRGGGGTGWNVPPGVFTNNPNYFPGVLPSKNP